LINFSSDQSSPFPAIKTIFATVEGDIHDIGKDIAITYFNSKGATPIDLGVNVFPEIILDHIPENEYTVLFLSGLITASYDSMKKTVGLIKEKGLRQRVFVIICGLVDEKVKNYVEADYFVKDVVESYDLYLKLAEMVG
jgi:methanogenic corrinoid protein MtbC1